MLVNGQRGKGEVVQPPPGLNVHMVGPPRGEIHEYSLRDEVNRMYNALIRFQRALNHSFYNSSYPIFSIFCPIVDNNYLLTGKKVQLYFPKMNSRYFIFRATKEREK